MAKKSKSRVVDDELSETLAEIVAACDVAIDSSKGKEANVQLYHPGTPTKDNMLAFVEGDKNSPLALIYGPAPETGCYEVDFDAYELKAYIEKQGIVTKIQVDMAKKRLNI